VVGIFWHIVGGSGGCAWFGWGLSGKWLERILSAVVDV